MRWLPAALLACLLSLSAWGEPIPALTGPLVDSAGLLSSSEHQSTLSFIERLNATKKVQLAVLIVPSLEGSDIESYALRVAEKWKLGAKGKDDGLLLVIAPKERRMRFEVGYGLEGDIPDVIAKRILSDEMAPLFRQKRYADGIQLAIELVAKRIGVDLPSRVDRSVRAPRGDPAGPLLFWLIVFLLVIFLVGAFFSPASRRHGGSDYWGGGGWGGGSSGGSWGGGGGFSGGGGSFGGGGSSSSW